MNDSTLGNVFVFGFVIFYIVVLLAPMWSPLPPPEFFTVEFQSK